MMPFEGLAFLHSQMNDMPPLPSAVSNSKLPFSRAIELAHLSCVSLDYIAGRTNDRAMNADTILQDDEKRLLEQFRSLSERNKGKAELFVEQLIKSQDEIENRRKNT